MDWFVLLLLFPAILVPVVLLWGFSGCEQIIGGLDVTYAPTAPASPSNLKATTAGTDSIKLEWQDNSGGAAKFDVLRVATSETLKDKTSGFVDGGRNDGSDFPYTVTATVSGLDSPPSNESKATTKPNAPANLVTTPEDIDKIKLEWTHTTKSNKDIKFKISHTRKTPLPVSTVELAIKAKDLVPPNTYIHPVAKGSDNEFLINAVVDGFQNSVSTPVESDPSATVSGKPLSFKADLNLGGIDQANLQGYCVVQLIPNAFLYNSGTKVRITIRGSSSAPTTIDRVYISQPAASGDPYDPLAAGLPGGLTKLVDVSMGDAPVVVAAGKSQIVGDPNNPAAYTLDETKDLLIAFDINGVAGQGNLRHVTFPGAVYYSRAGAKEAASPNRTAAGFAATTNTLYLVEKIEVF